MYQTQDHARDLEAEPVDAQLEVDRSLLLYFV